MCKRASIHRHACVCVRGQRERERERERKRIDFGLVLEQVHNIKVVGYPIHTRTHKLMVYNSLETVAVLKAP